MIAKVLVDVKAKQVDRMFDYEIPEKLINVLQVGARVIVPFNHRKVMGYCLEISHQSTYKQPLKSIERLIDIESYLNQELIDIAKTLSQETGYLMISVLETILPSALKVMYKPTVELIDKEKASEDLLALFEDRRALYIENLDKDQLAFIIEGLKTKALKQIYTIKKKNKALTKQFVELLVQSEDKLSQKQKAVFRYLNERPSKQDLVPIVLNRLNISRSVIHTMVKHGYVRIQTQEVYRKVESLYKKEPKTITLNQEQEKAYLAVKEKLGQNHTILLHGVTGSGKTEIYMKAIEETIKRNQNVILLVPEISLTPMMIQRFKSKFKHLVATIHSGLSSMEKYDEWRRIIGKEARIVIGARSACFAPIDDIGLMIVDECHESTYKQSDNLPYYAIDILKKRSKHHQALLLLGSATPNIESYARVSRGYYQLLKLENRALNSQMPRIKVVNMLEAFKDGQKDEISKPLHQAIQQRLENHEQVILLINRRGYANFMICRDCGHVIKCKNCDISLTYHQDANALKCHYCAYEQALPNTCPKCGSEHLEFMGSGTQKIEHLLESAFPKAKIFRMDTDTTRRKNAHEHLLHDFQNHGDILIGTQMIAKGLDFPKVTLVGILQADANLFVPDFRAPEKTFQLIMQVSGRSGRRDTLGQVIIQAYNPDHYAIKYAYENDYQGFYEHEMRLRRIARYEPFYFLTQLDITGNSIKHVTVFGMQVVKALRKHTQKDTIILGPSSDILKINNKFTTSIMIKYKHEPHMSETIHQLMSTFMEKDILIRVDRFPGVG